MPKLILLSQNFTEFNRKGCYFHSPKEEQRHGNYAWSVPEQKQDTAPQTGLMACSPELAHPEPAILLASDCT